MLEAIQNKVISKLSEYDTIRTEVPYGKQNSRIDILLEQGKSKCFIEVKNVTMREGDTCQFPDSVTLRGQKHLQELMEMVKEGHRAVMLYLIQRSDGNGFSPAAHIDPEYAKLMKQAVARGVEMLPLQSCITPQEIRVSNTSQIFDV